MAAPAGRCRSRGVRRLCAAALSAGVLLLGCLCAAGVAAGPAAAGEFVAGSDWRHLWQVLAALQSTPPDVPVVYLLGGSAARECTIDDRNWKFQIMRLGGPRVRPFNLGASSQSFDHNLRMVAQMPAVPTIVLIGINVGRYTHRERTAAGEAGEPWGATDEGRRTAGTTIDPYYQHRFTVTRILSDSEKRALVTQWMRERYPVFQDRYAYNEGQLDALIVACQTAGLHPVLLNLPINLQTVRHGFDKPRDRYGAGCRALAAKYQIPYIDFVPSISLVSGDFRDNWHLVEPGRVKWQRRLTRVLITLLDQYDMGESGTGAASGAL
jgi:hypothetical protein